MDHGFPDYEENQEVYKQLGMQKEDVQYYSNWNFADPQIFNVESISKLVALQQDTKEQMVDKKILSEYLLQDMPNMDGCHCS